MLLTTAVLVLLFLVVVLDDKNGVRGVRSISPRRHRHSDGRGRGRVRKVVIGVDGGTESLRACCFDAENGDVVGKACATPYKTYHPQPGWAEQDPNDWYECLVNSVREAVKSVKSAQSDDQGDDHGDDQGDDHGDDNVEICGICLDTTCCSVVALDEKGEPLRRCLLWMDARSAPQTETVMTKCRGDPALRVNCDGDGPLSAEWMTPKALWIKENEPEVWERAKTICEYQDFLNFKLTGRMVASSCNAASRWHWDGELCITEGDPKAGRPLSLYETLGMPELATKLPQTCLPMGSPLGRLTAEAARHLGLPEGLLVVQGGPDAFVGMIGLGCVRPGHLCLITGSSHLHCVVSSTPASFRGTWGAYRGAPLPGINFAEGGQSSTGSVLRWAKALFGNHADYKTLDEEASHIPPGSDGLLALETFQGSRTPVTDPLARGALVGLTLSHTRAHVWRALMEAVCYGTKACVEGLANAGHVCEAVVIAGGSTRSNVWLQMHADVMGKPVVVCENSDAPLMGCAILASLGAGIHGSISDAVSAMVRVQKRVEPDEAVSARYGQLFETLYRKMAPSVKDLVHGIAAQRHSRDYNNHINVRGGGTSANANTKAKANANANEKNADCNPPEQEEQKRKLIVSPSLLACDWCDMKSEIQRCLDNSLRHFHVDIFDGVALDSPMAFTFGPKMVESIRRQFPDRDSVVLDLHMCVDRPERFVRPMAEAGATRFIFMWEGTDDGDGEGTSALDLAKFVVEMGLKCGISINPKTKVEEVFPLLRSGLVDCVDCLAVEPGFGGQKLQESVLEKIRRLAAWREETPGVDFTIMIDGGVNSETCRRAIEAGADLLVAGTFLFQHPTGLQKGKEELLVSDVLLPK